jgi:esterase
MKRNWLKKHRKCVPLPINHQKMELFFREYGAGSPVVIVHGLFGFNDNWQTVAKSLGEKHTVYALDLRNHGRSPHVEEHNYPAIAEDIRDFLEKNWLFKTALIGHSMGGKAVMQFAFDFPEMVEKLVVLDMSPKKAANGGHDDIFEALFNVELDSLSSRSEAEAILSVQIPETGVRQFLMKNLTRNDEGGFAWKMNLPVLFREYPHILAAVSGDPFAGETLFVRGAKSDYILDKDWPAILNLFPQAKLETIAGAGHWVHADKPKELLAILHAFLD